MPGITEMERTIPVIGKFDVVVLGGSATGVFAAVRAARMGAKVAIIEQSNCFGGTAANSLVANWHSLLDFRYETRIIGGLIQEVLDRLDQRGALVFKPRTRNAYYFNQEELKIELDSLILEHSVRPFLHAHFSSAVVEGRRLTYLIIEDKSRRRAIGAAGFVDASGDGDLAARAGAGADFELSRELQPGTCVYRTVGMPPRSEFDLTRCVAEHGNEVGLAPDMGWYYEDPVVPGVFSHYDTHTFGVVACDADNLTDAEMRGRRQARAVMDLIRRYAPGGDTVRLVDLPSRLGIRETRHIACLHRVTGDELLSGTRFPDAIGAGTYPPDIHDPLTGETILRYLDGTETTTLAGGKKKEGRWRPESADFPLYYQIPYRALVSRNFDNLLIAGRCIDADPWAFGALRVQVNCMQTGEAAGTAAAMISKSQLKAADIDLDRLREEMIRGGTLAAPLGVIPAP